LEILKIIKVYHEVAQFTQSLGPQKNTPGELPGMSNNIKFPVLYKLLKLLR